MKVAFVTPEFITEKENFDGGLANYLNRLTIGLVDAGHSPHVFVSAEKDETFNYMGVTVHRVAIAPQTKLFKLKHFKYRNFDGIMKFLNAAWQLKRAVEIAHLQENFDIVQYSSYGLTAYYRSWMIPGIVRISSWERLFREADSSIAATPAQLALEELELQTIKNGDKIFAPSAHTSKRLEQEIKREIKVIPSAFELPKTELNNEIFEQKLFGKKYLLFWGSIRELKGAHLIGEILPELLEKHPDLHFVFVGKSFGLWERMFPNFASVKERVHYLGKLNQSELYPIIKNAYAAVLPSLFDNFPNACLEGMGLGQIVIGTRGVAFDEIIVDNQNGILVEKGSKDSLLEGIERVLALSATEHTAMKQAALTTIKDYSLSKLLPPLLDYYQETIRQFKAK